MDKFEKILDIIDHQNKYSDEEIREILQDEECRKLYRTMQEVDSALMEQKSLLIGKEDSGLMGKGPTKVDIDEEWKRFSAEHHLSEKAEESSSEIEIHSLYETPNHQTFSWRKIAASIAGFVLISGIAYAAIHSYIKRSQEPMLINGNTEVVAQDSDSLSQKAAKDSLQLQPKTEKPAIHKTFENVAFDKMMAEIASYYDMQVKFDNAEAKNLRLYYEWDSHSNIESVVKDLNQFENVNIEVEGNSIIVK